MDFRDLIASLQATVKSLELGDNPIELDKNFSMESEQNIAQLQFEKAHPDSLGRLFALCRRW